MTFSTEFQNFDVDPTFSTTITLPSEALDWAVNTCQKQPDTNQQWSAFIKALAIKGLQEWLDAGALELSLCYDSNQFSGQGIDCQVGDFRLHLITQGSLIDDRVTIPQATLDDDYRYVHLYILVVVHEEDDQVTILCGLRRDHLLAYQQQSGLVVSPDNTYTLPISCFDTSPEKVLLYLNCLSPEMLAMANKPLVPEKPKVFTLGTGVPVNAGYWLRNQLDAVAESLNWILMPPLAPNHALMSINTPEEELEAILRDLDTQRIKIPSTARGLYVDLQQHQGLPFRMYIKTWPLLESKPAEWSLFLVLGPAPGQPMPIGTRLLLKDATSTVAAPRLKPDSGPTYLYALGIGTWDEQFTATIELPNGIRVELPPFTFNLDV